MLTLDRSHEKMHEVRTSHVENHTGTKQSSRQSIGITQGC